MLRAPIEKPSSQSWLVQPGAFGATRDDGRRKHAGCDIYAPAGTEVRAITRGQVIRAPYEFYRGTWAVDIDHFDFIARYCELEPNHIKLEVGTLVTGADTIGKVGKISGIDETMLHLEIYTGKCSGPLTVSGEYPFERRGDLIDPTPFLIEIYGVNV